MRSRLLIPGPPLMAFAQAFDGLYGDPRTPRPYVRVSPANVGGVLLPFPCPHCQAVCPEVVDPQKRSCYADPARGFSWCPACGRRYILDAAGAPLAEALLPGATSAPARVERGGIVERPVPAPVPCEAALEMLGVVALPASAAEARTT